MKKSKNIYSAEKKWRINSKNAQKYGEFLERLAILNKGKLTPHDVVRAAKSEDSPLHDYFEWDDSIAANKFRLEQARYLLRTIEIVIEYKKQSQKERMFFNIKISKSEQAYVPVQVIAKDEALRQQVIQQALDELISWQTKYKRYKELGKIFGAIEDIQKELNYKEARA